MSVARPGADHWRPKSEAQPLCVNRRDAPEVCPLFMFVHVSLGAPAPPAQALETSLSL